MGMASLLEEMIDRLSGRRGRELALSVAGRRRRQAVIASSIDVANSAPGSIHTTRWSDRHRGSAIEGKEFSRYAIWTISGRFCQATSPSRRPTPNGRSGPRLACYRYGDGWSLGLASAAEQAPISPPAALQDLSAWGDL
jgi:hypothetical protein